MGIGKGGSVLVESLVSLLVLILPCFFFHLELIRAAQYQSLLHHWAFRYVRERAMGSSEERARDEFLTTAKLAFGSGEYRKLSNNIHSDLHFLPSRGLRGRLRYRYPGFLARFHERFQVTKTCLFFF